MDLVSFLKLIRFMEQRDENWKLDQLLFLGMTLFLSKQELSERTWG